MTLACIALALLWVAVRLDRAAERAERDEWERLH